MNIDSKNIKASTKLRRSCPIQFWTEKLTSPLLVSSFKEI